MVMTGAAVATLPTLIVFLIFQRFIIRGVVMAGLKG
jgi:multiple sugar transport system permease protein